jgi:dipeptidyl aminopeptidase/acylaminoacyl peptidase
MNLLSIVLLAQVTAAKAPPAPVTTIADARPAAGNANVLVSRVPEASPELRARVRQYLNARAAKLLDTTPDGKHVLIATRFADTSQLHVIDAPMGARTQLTFSAEPVNSARFSPTDPDVLYYLSDVGGGEFFQLFQLDRKSGRSTMLTDGKSRHEAFTVSADGKRLAYSGTGRNGKDTDVYVADTATADKGRLIVQADGSYTPVEFSRDGAKLLVLHERAIDDADLWLVDVASGDKKMLTPDPKAHGKAGIRAARFSTDGKSVWLVTDRDRDFAELYRVDAMKPDAAWTPMTRDIAWNVDDVVASADGKTLAFTVNEDGLTKLYLYDVAKKKREVVATPAGVVASMHFPLRSSDTLLITLDNARSPADVWSIALRGALKGGKRALTRWTRSEVGGLDAARFPMPELVRYPSTDGVTVSAYLYRPEKHAGGGGGGKVPVIIVWHGGPESQYRPDFSSTLALFTDELGVAVLAPNVRGSDGYGKKFLQLDDGIKREASLADIGATLDWIGKQADLDAARIGVYGGSYGGYMTLATAAFFGARVRAAVDVVGISSLPTFLEHTQAYRRDLRRVEYGDERVPEVLAVQKRISPLNSVDKIQAAMFVQQGKNDPRVPQSEAEQIVTALRKRGKDAWYFLALNDGHGFQKKENRDLAVLSTIQFFAKELGVANQAAAR